MQPLSACKKHAKNTVNVFFAFFQTKHANKYDWHIYVMFIVMLITCFLNKNLKCLFPKKEYSECFIACLLSRHTTNTQHSYNYVLLTDILGIFLSYLVTKDIINMAINMWHISTKDIKHFFAMFCA